MKGKLTTLFIGLTTTVVGVVLGWYLSDVYQQPKILWYSRPYYKIADSAIGNIFLWNAGRKTDRNITITLDTNIKDGDLKIVDLTSSYEVKHNDNKTTIIIAELKPEEMADITFKDDSAKDDVLISTFVSEHSNIKEVSFAIEPEWWQFPLWLETVLATALLAVGTLFGYLFARRKLKQGMS